MKLKHYTLYISIVLSLFSCTAKIDPIFDDTSANRIEAEMESVQEILLSSPNGWLMEYYPSSSQAYGGFNVLLSFYTGNRVMVASETAGADDTAISTYTLKQSAGCVLSFDSYNAIFHYFSDPANPKGSGDGYGMEGDFEFTILNASEQQILMKGKKSGSYATMTPISASIKWSEYLANIKEEGKKLAEYYRLLCQIGDQSYEARLSEHVLRIYQQIDDEQVVTPYPFITTLMGCKFYRPIQINDMEIDGLVFNAGMGEEGVFIPSNGADGMFIPTYPSVNEMLISRNWFFAYSGFSPYGKSLWNTTKEALDAAGDEITYCCLGNITNISGDFYVFRFMCSKGNGYLAFDYELTGQDKISMKFSEEGSVTGDEYYKDFKFNYLITPLGNTEQRTFTLTSDDKKSPNWIKFTDDKDPENYFTVYRSMIYYPMDN